MTAPRAAAADSLLSPEKVRILALVYAAFILYGSLVPLDFQSRPLDEAIALFRNIPLLELGAGSRADWVANLILYLPLGFLGMGALSGRRASVAGLAWATVGSMVLVATLAVAIEFAQLFFPPRTVSLNDLYAEWLGGALGIALWPAAGAAVSRLGQRFAAGGRAAVHATLIAYALAYLFLSLFPYDFLISLDEWRAHWSGDQVGGLFAAACGATCGIKLVPEAVAVMPFGILLALRARHISLATAAGAGLLLGVLIEGAQLAIASGLSQGASVASRSVGVALGACLPAWFARWESRRMQPWVRAALLLAVVPYLVALTMLNRWWGGGWINPVDALARLAEIRFIPFYYHYYTSEGVALVSLVFQFGLYAPVGAAVWGWQLGGWRRALRPAVSALVAASLAVVVEGGKLFVLTQHADPTNILIAGAAAWSVHALLETLFSGPPRATQRPTDAAPAVLPATRPSAATEPPAPAFARADAPDAAGASHPTAPRVDRSQSRPRASRVLAGLWALAATASFAAYPTHWLVWLVPLLLALAAVSWKWPGSWIWLVPAALPLLDFSSRSGRLFWNEFDTLLLLVLAAAYAQPRVRPRWKWPGRIPLSAYVLSAAVALLIGLWPPAPLDLNALTHYTSSYHALHAVKGLAFALAFLPLILAEWQRDAARFGVWLAAGMVAGLVGELGYVLWERATYSGLWNFDTDYRITGSFTGMHIGGASIEAYLVLAAPFAWLWAWQRRRAWSVVAAGVIYCVAAYGVMVTFSRGGQAAFAVATLLAFVGYAVLVRRTRQRVWRGVAVLAAAVVAASLVAWPIVGGKFSQARLATIGQDLDTRTAHWRDALNILDSAGSPLWGAGAGTFPAAFYWHSSAPARPATYAFVREGANTFLRLGGGESLYFEQLVAVEPGQRYRLQAELRSSAPAATLTVPLCEKALLYSFTCAWGGIKVRPGSDWQRYEIPVSTDGFGPPGSLLPRPVKLSMFNQDAKALIDVDNVALLDEQGRDLVRNGDFSRGMQSWFFSTDSHLAWHVKNLFVHVLFEQGWIGLVAFLALLATTAASLLRRAGRDALALTLLVAISAFGVVGLVDSLIDEPRLDFLFFWLLAIALVSAGQPAPTRRLRRGGHGGAAAAPSPSAEL